MADGRRTAIAVLAATLLALPPLAAQTRSLALTRVSVIDVVTGHIETNSTVVIEQGTITSVTPGGKAPARAQVVDGRGAFLIPGLWDMHAHTEASGEAWLPLYVANGVTGIRDMGSALDYILRLRDATASGTILGPRILAAGPILDDAPGDWPFRMRVKTADDGRAAVQLLKQRGVNLIKVHDNTPQPVFFAIADEARRQGLPLAGHVPRGLTVEQVIEAGQRSIEHLSNGRVWRTCSGGATYQPEKCRPLFAMLAQNRVWQTPTLVAIAEILSIGTSRSEISADQMTYAGKQIRRMWAENQGLVNPDAIGALRATAQTSAIVINDMAKAGVGILAGCDSMIAGFCVHDELAAMVRGGMPPLVALQTATINPARYFGIEATAGNVAPGRRADLVLLDANPLLDITNVRRILAVVASGRFLDRPALDQTLAKAKAAAGQ
ncbi:MAG TPA: amidohydrolase family protein [Vicinamibacterales bacterium]|jgi:imidazolonepropionase-like amidohydrolase|nr:amidohydrolase family protein [Vicinamibacterales bacterium]